MDTIINIDGIILTPLKQIFHPQGNVFHGMKQSDPGYAGFGEAYFSTINYNEIKPWKKHTEMTLNFIVPIGEIQFVIYDDRPESKTKGNFFKINLSPSLYQRITIPRGVWVAFSGVGKEINLLLNIANLEHDPLEVERAEFSSIKYDW